MACCRVEWPCGACRERLQEACGSTPPSPLTPKPGAELLLESTTIPYLSTLGTGADGDRPGGGEGRA